MCTSFVHCFRSKESYAGAILHCKTNFCVLLRGIFMLCLHQSWNSSHWCFARPVCLILPRYAAKCQQRTWRRWKFLVFPQIREPRCLAFSRFWILATLALDCNHYSNEEHGHTYLLWQNVRTSYWYIPGELLLFTNYPCGWKHAYFHHRCFPLRFYICQEKHSYFPLSLFIIYEE